ncbi:hypothetical protein [Streptomyces lavendulocolor]|uniref:hypothetical protein n=1 Tax=Streptomyces lavendulocolor TaxID=67316 RepID=UPI0033C71A6B
MSATPGLLVTRQGDIDLASDWGGRAHCTLPTRCAGGIVMPGTLRDSLGILDAMFNLDGRSARRS